jgi:hypothetical protein
MPEQSEKLGLSLPLGNETVNRAVYRANLVEIDKKAAAQAQVDEPFFLKSAVYDLGGNKIDLTFGLGKAAFLGTIVSKISDSAYAITTPVINTSYYIFIMNDGTFTHNLDGAEIAGAVLIWKVMTGAEVDDIMNEDQRGRLCGAAARIVQDNLDNHEAAVNPHPQYANQSLDGWVSITATCTYVSADDPIFILNITGDHTYLTPGNRFRCSQPTGGQKDFIIHAVGAYSAGVTPITIFGGTGIGSTDLINEAITDVFYSREAFPAGFDSNTARWQILLLDSTDITLNVSTAYAWTNFGHFIDVPVGEWELGYIADIRSYNLTSINAVSLSATLSITNNSETMHQLTDNFVLSQLASAMYHIIRIMRAAMIVKITGKTRYYLNIQANTASDITSQDVTIYARSRWV